ncbi:MAG: YceI family protein [Acidobacteria bacterium]|nr:YceI family protein [Acidobacteriota bacterium]
MSDLRSLTPGTWTVDASHSTIGFVARHLMVAKVRGRFNEFSGTITVAEDPLQSKVDAVVQIASVETNDAGRNGHLLGADFFDAEHFPTMELATTGIEVDGDDYVLHTQLTIKGVTRPVDFELEFEGVETDPWGNTKAGFSAEAEVNRKDWGLEWNVALETGGVLVGEKVKILLEIEALKA